MKVTKEQYLSAEKKFWEYSNKINDIHAKAKLSGKLTDAYLKDVYMVVNGLIEKRNKYEEVLEKYEKENNLG